MIFFNIIYLSDGYNRRGGNHYQLTLSNVVKVGVVGSIREYMTCQQYPKCIPTVYIYMCVCIHTHRVVHIYTSLSFLRVGMDPVSSASFLMSSTLVLGSLESTGTFAASRPIFIDVGLGGAGLTGTGLAGVCVTGAGLAGAGLKGAGLAGAGLTGVGLGGEGLGGEEGEGRVGLGGEGGVGLGGEGGVGLGGEGRQGRMERSSDS